MIRVRMETPEDGPQVRTVNELAFEQSAEANVVERLRRVCPDLLSLVAEEDDLVVGHILFSPVVVDGGARRVEGMGLAPVAVLPDRQRRGIGSALVRRGLDILRGRGCPFVIVLGHPAYYPRFGFQIAAEYGLSCQWEGVPAEANVPDEAFMVAIMDPAAMADVSGVARYRDEFDEAM
jgi:putative acetyltransferase